MHSDVNPVTSFGDCVVEPDSVNKKFWTSAAHKFYDSLSGTDKAIAANFLKDYSSDHEKGRILDSIVVGSLSYGLSNGLSMEEMESMNESDTFWMLQEAKSHDCSLKEFIDLVESGKISSVTPSYKIDDLLAGDELGVRRSLDDSVFQMYLKLKERKKLPDWVETRDDVVSVMGVIVCFGVSEDITYLNNIKHLTKEDCSFLSLYSRGNLFTLLCLKPILEHKEFIVNYNPYFLGSTLSCNSARWMRVEREGVSVTFPLYSCMQYKEEIYSILELKESSEVFVWVEDNQVVVRILTRTQDYSSVNYYPDGISYPADVECEDPVLAICNDVIKTFGIKDVYDDFTKVTKLYFIFNEIASGNEDWLRVFELDTFDQIFSFYRKGRSLAFCLWALACAYTNTPIGLCNSVSINGCISVDGVEYSLYDVMDSEKNDAILTALLDCKDSTTIVFGGSDA